MSVTDEIVQANQQYAKNFDLGDLAIPPKRKTAILACMDARVNVEELLGLKTGEAHIIRNAGGIVSEDALRSLIISHHLLGTQEFVLIHHTDCGMLTFRDEELRNRLHKETGVFPIAPFQFFAFEQLDKDVKEQIEKIKSHPWIPNHILVRGFIFDVKTGKLHEVLN